MGPAVDCSFLRTSDFAAAGLFGKMHEQKSVRDTVDHQPEACLAEVAILEHFRHFNENTA